MQVIEWYLCISLVSIVGDSTSPAAELEDSCSDSEMHNRTIVEDSVSESDSVRLTSPPPLSASFINHRSSAVPRLPTHSLSHHLMSNSSKFSMPNHFSYSDLVKNLADPSFDIKKPSHPLQSQPSTSSILPAAPDNHMCRREPRPPDSQTKVFKPVQAVGRSYEQAPIHEVHPLRLPTTGNSTEQNKPVSSTTPSSSAAVQQSANGGHRGDHRSSAINVECAQKLIKDSLKHFYACGEITRREYHRILERAGKRVGCNLSFQSNHHPQHCSILN